MLASIGAVQASAAMLHRSVGATVTFALPVGVSPNYIFPLASGNVGNNVDLFQFSPFLFRPLYWYGKGSSPNLNYSQSMAGPPSFSNGGRTVTIRLNRRYTWSDGQPVTNRDVELWMQLLTNEKQNYFGYAVGSIPDDITASSYPAASPYTFSLTFNRAYSPRWILYNQLSEITPLPRQTMDRTSASSAVGNFAATRAGAIAVYNFLNGQSKNQSTYVTNPLWGTVDGPWHLSSFTPATGASSFVPNPRYTGPGKPKIARFEEIPFTSTTAEFDALRAGEVDYGYLPPEDASQRSYFTTHGYHVEPWVDFGFNSLWINYTNPIVGPIFKQLYIRQALQMLINQPAISRDIYHGFAYPVYSPIPTQPPNPYSSPATSRNPYPYSVTAARRLLASHGWKVHPNGTDTCVGNCGAGIAKGAALNFTEVVASGSAPFTSEMAAMQSSWSLAGIHVTLRTGSVGSVFSELTPCKKGLKCPWEMGNFGEIGSTPTYSPEYLPIGTQWFASNGSTNAGGYSSRTMDALITKAGVDPAPSAVSAIGVYAAKQLPALWEPNYYYQVSVISDHIHGAVPQDPNLNLYPQDWSYS